MQKQIFRGYPTGWFVISFSSEIEIGQIKNLKYFGKQLIAFRDDKGKIHVLDAYCPHLGANIGFGGKVFGSTIECPFHGWRFNSDGSCTEIPNTKVIPKKAYLNSWKVDEKNGLIFVHHPLQEIPKYFIPEINEYDQKGWLPWQGEVTQRIRVYDGDIVENMADISHFKYVHCTDLDLNTSTFEFKNYTVSLETSGTAYPPMVKEEQTTRYRSVYYGPGYEITEYDGEIKNIILIAHTMVDEDYVDLRYAFFCNLAADTPVMKYHVEETLASMKMGLDADIVIWENKIYRTEPVLSENDKYIQKIRTWYQSFFADSNS